MKTSGIVLFVLIFIFLAGCGIMGGPTNPSAPRPTNTPIRWYQPVTTFTPLATVTTAAQIPVSGNSLPPTVSVSIATNCRRGPSADYDILLAFMPGQTAAVLGKYTPVNYWVIQTANGYTCWLWGQNAVVTGDMSLAPDYPVPPLPTPTYLPAPINQGAIADAPTLAPTPAPTLTPVPQDTPPPPKIKPSPPPPEPKPTKAPKPKPKSFFPGGNGNGNGNGGFISVFNLV